MPPPRRDAPSAPGASRRRHAWVIALVSGVVFATTSPPIDLHVGVLLGLAGFAVSMAGIAADRRRLGLLCGWCFGLGANLVALRFVPEVILRFTPLPVPAAYLALVLLAAAQALPWALGALATQLLGRRFPALPGALAFAIGIYIATFLPAIFPWTPAGGLTPWPALVQVAEVVGERGVSFLVALAAGLAAHALGRARTESPRAALAPAGLAMGVLAVMLGYGAVRMAAVERARTAAPHARITLVQPGFEASDRWAAERADMMIERLTVLTKSAELRGTDLTVWPESAYPYTIAHAARHSPGGMRAVLHEGVQGPVLTGAYLQGAKGLGYNSAILATRDGKISEPYDKRHLLWFGETVPMAETFPWLRETFSKGTGLVPGHASVLFETGPIRAAVLNCYEDTLPEAGREAMEKAPNVLVNITNDAWFAGSAEGELHLRLAVLRAVETRRDLVRAVNRGPTSFVEATGRVRSRYDLDIPGTLPTSAALLTTPPTLFVRFGDLPLLVLLLAAVLRHKKPRAPLSEGKGARDASTAP